jgi:hypothetical protein
MPRASSSSPGEDAVLLPSSTSDNMPSDVAGSASSKREGRKGDSLALASLVLGLGLFVGGTGWIVACENWSSLGSPFSFHPSGQSLGIALLVIGASRLPHLQTDLILHGPLTESRCSAAIGQLQPTATPSSKGATSSSVRSALPLPRGRYLCCAAANPLSIPLLDLSQPRA